MFWPLNFDISISQNWVSDLASSVTAKVSYHDCCVFSKAWRPLVINLAIGPKAIDIAIILPIKLAKTLACSWGFCAACPNCVLGVTIFSCGTEILPRWRSMSNPSHVPCCKGVHLHLATLTTKPALARSCWLYQPQARLLKPQYHHPGRPQFKVPGISSTLLVGTITW